MYALERTKERGKKMHASTTPSLTPWSTVFQELTGSQLVKKVPAFCGTRKFITAFTSARHLSVP